MVLVLFAFSSAGFAASNKDVLKSLYESATRPASPADFPEADFWTGQSADLPKFVCVELDRDDHPFWFNISRVVRVTQGHGPLIPEKREEKLFFGSKNGFDLATQPQIVGPDLVVVNPEYNRWVSQDTGDSHAVVSSVFARRTDDYISFRRTVDYGIEGAPHEEYFGYCYPPQYEVLF
jgi:hypothetical protein